MLYHIVATLLLVVPQVFADSHMTCHRRRQGQIVIPKHGWFACGGTQEKSGGAELCCMDGDQCGEDSICHKTDGSGDGSPWYVGGCTDKTYNDPVCRTSCTEDLQQYIEWNNQGKKGGYWQCCGDYGCHGNNTIETFKGVSPSQWHAVSSSELSEGAKIGIGVGAGIGALIVLTGIAVCIFRRRHPGTRQAFNRKQQGRYEELRHQEAAAADRSRGYNNADSSELREQSAPLASGSGYGERPPIHSPQPSPGFRSDQLEAMRSNTSTPGP